jgi:hypothetical protein
MKFLDVAKSTSASSIFNQSVFWRVTLSATAPGTGRKSAPETLIADVAETLCHSVALHAAKHALEKHETYPNTWDSITVTISKHSNLPQDAV